MFTALPSVAATVAEIEHDDDALLEDTRDLWRTVQIVVGLATLLVFGLALLSMRTPVAPIGAGVRFYPTSLPPGAVVLGEDEAEELRQAGAYARKRIESQQARLDELEATKLRLEGDLQRALSSRSMPTGTTPAIPRPGGQGIEPPMPAGMPVPVPAPEVPVIRVPDPEPVAETPAAASAPDPEPIAEPEPKPVPAPEPEPEPAPAATTERSRNRSPSPNPNPNPNPSPSPTGAPARADRGRRPSTRTGRGGAAVRDRRRARAIAPPQAPADEGGARTGHREG